MYARAQMLLHQVGHSVLLSTALEVNFLTLRALQIYVLLTYLLTYLLSYSGVNPARRGR